MNKTLMRQVGAGKYVDAVESGKCPFCKKNVSDMTFKDDLSKAEFRISGLCQECQDEVFTPEKEEL